MLADGRIPTLVVAVATLLLAAWIVWLRPKDRVHRAFALFLLMRALFYIAVPFNTSTGDLAGRLAGYAALAIPFAALSFLRVVQRRYRNSRGPGPGRDPWRWGLLGAAVAAQAWYLVDHAMVVPGTDVSAFPVFFAGIYAAYALAGLVLARAYRVAPHGTHRRSFFLLSLGFCVEGLFRSLHLVPQAVVFRDAVLADAGVTAAMVLYFLAVALTLGAVVAINRAPRPSGRSHIRWRYLLVLGIVVLSASLTSTATLLEAPWANDPLLFAVESVWVAMLVVLSVYALLRYHLFGIELQVKKIIDRGTLAASVAAIFLVLGEVIESTLLALAPDTPFANSTAAGVMAAVLIAAALQPLQNLAHRVADQVMPWVEDTEAYQRRRARELYQAALENAIEDDVITDKERAVLETVRAHLDIPKKEAVAMEAKVLETARTAPRARSPRATPGTA